MKNVLLFMVMASSATYATPTTTVTCFASAPSAGVLLNHTVTGTGMATCSDNTPSPFWPASNAYLIQSSINGDLMRGAGQTLAAATLWESSTDLVFARATAAMADMDSVLFPGSGFGTLRLDVDYQQSTSGNGGVARFGVNGQVDSVTAVSVLTNRKVMDFTVPLGAMFLWQTDMFFTGNSQAMTGGHSGMVFRVAQMRLYDSAGDQLNIDGSGSRGAYDIQFGANDTSRGPAIAGVPEPSSLGLGVIGGALLLAWKVIASRRV